MTLRLTTLLCALGVLFSSCKDSPPQVDVSPPVVDLLAVPQEWDFGARAYTHTEKILSFGPRPVESAALASTRAYITAELKKYGWTSIQQPFEADTPHGRKNFTNVIARYSPKADSRIWSRPVKGVFAAHIDSKNLNNFLGADDAASCVGAILEIAEYLHQHHPEQASKLELVFFDGEEAIGPNIYYQESSRQDGLFGSHHYSRHVSKCASRGTAPYPSFPEFGILLDMIGHKDLIIKIPADTPKKLRESYEKARQQLKAAENFQYSESVFLDDHVPMNLYGIPTIDLIGDFSTNEWWHTTEDNIDIISRKSLSISIRMALLISSHHL